MTNRERIQALLDGQSPDRVMTFDLLRNDAVISHYAGETLTFDNAEEVCFLAAQNALDATRPQIRIPSREREETLPDGRKSIYRRWTTWTEHMRFDDAEAFSAHLRREVIENPTLEYDDRTLDEIVQQQAAWSRQLGETQLFW